MGLKRLSLILFVVLLLKSSPMFTKEHETSLQTNIFFSFLQMFEFFKDASPSSNKMMNFHHYETTHRNINLLQANETSSNGSNQTNQTLTAEDIKEIIHKENQDLRKEIKKNEDNLSDEIEDWSKDIDSKINNAEERISDRIDKSSDILEKRLDKIEEKVDSNIRQTEESTLIIISQQIQEKQHDLDILQKEIYELKEVVNNDKEITSICSLYTSCEDCNVNAHCGWCLLEKKCVSGDHIGPFEDQCNLYSFHYCSSMNCARNTDCYVVFCIFS